MGKNIDLSSHPEIKCHVQQLLLHCYSSIVFFPSLEIFFLILRIKMYPLSSEERWQIHTATGLQVLSSISVLFDERHASGNTNIWWLPAPWKQKYFQLLLHEINISSYWPQRDGGWAWKCIWWKYGWKGKTYKTNLFEKNS